MLRTIARAAAALALAAVVLAPAASSHVGGSWPTGTGFAASVGGSWPTGTTVHD